MCTTSSYETSFQICCKMWICRLGPINGSRVTVPHYIFVLQFRNSRTARFQKTMDRTNWTNSMACSLPWLQSLKFIPMVKSEIYCYATEVTELQGVHQRIQTAFEMIRTTAGIFQPVMQSLYRSAKNCFDSQGEYRGGRNSETMFQKAYVRKTIFYLYFGVDSPSVGLACTCHSLCKCLVNFTNSWTPKRVGLRRIEHVNKVQETRNVHRVFDG
jgi:hypothetical protein